VTGLISHLALCSSSRGESRKRKKEKKGGRKKNKGRKEGSPDCPDGNQ
jgi:ribosomal protein L19E